MMTTRIIPLVCLMAMIQAGVGKVLFKDYLNFNLQSTIQNQGASWRAYYPNGRYVIHYQLPWPAPREVDFTNRNSFKIECEKKIREWDPAYPDENVRNITVTNPSAWADPKADTIEESEYNWLTNGPNGAKLEVITLPECGAVVSHAKTEISGEKTRIQDSWLFHSEVTYQSEDDMVQVGKNLLIPDNFCGKICPDGLGRQSPTRKIEVGRRCTIRMGKNCRAGPFKVMPNMGKMITLGKIQEVNGKLIWEEYPGVLYEDPSFLEESIVKHYWLKDAKALAAAAAADVAYDQVSTETLNKVLKDLGFDSDDQDKYKRVAKLADTLGWNPILFMCLIIFTVISTILIIISLAVLAIYKMICGQRNEPPSGKLF